MIRAAFFDIDGTLLSHRTNSVPASAKYAVAALRAKGVRVFIASGRHITAIRGQKQLAGMEFDGYVTVNGQYCMDGQGVIYDNPLSSSDVREMLAHAKAHDLALGFMEAGGMYVNCHNEAVVRLHEIIHMPPPPIGDLDAGCANRVYQMIVYADSEQIERLPRLAHTRMTRWVVGGVDLVPASGSKAVGIAHVLRHYGMSPEEAIAFGDGENDVEMFSAVGTSVAMGNGCDALKALSTHVTDSVDEDGIYNALVRLGEIEPMKK